MTHEEILEEARERLASCFEAESEERERMRDDLRFCTLDQWPAEIRRLREDTTQAGGPRPCLTIDKINQYVSQVVNDMRQNRPAIKVRPVDDAGDVETAKILQGKARHIEDISSANVAYLTGGESAVRIGVGYFRVITDYEDEKSFDQEIYIKPIEDSFSVYLGPHTMPDGSDAEWGFIVEDVQKEVFKREHPKAKCENADFLEVDNDGRWHDEKTIRRAEYFYFEYTPAKLLFLDDGKSILEDEYKKLPEPRPAISKTRETQVKKTKWCKLTAVDVLDERDWAGIYIPIVKVVGREAIVEGKRRSWGLVRPAKDALRAFNYWVSAITEKMALSPKAPYIGAVGQFAGQEHNWDTSNTVNHGRLEYNPIDVNGQPVPPPQRQAPAPVEAAMLGMLPILEHGVQTALGMFKASVGNAEHDQSGRAILALQRESDTGTFHFADNLSLSIRHCGRIVVDLIPKIHDARSMLRLIGEDGEASIAHIDNQQQVGMRQITDAMGKVKKIYNPGVGKFDVTVTTGPSYNTKRMEAAQVFSDLAKGATDPVSAAVMRYLTVKNSDFTSSDEAIHMLKAQIPPAILPPKEGEQPIPPQVIHQVEQMKQGIQALSQENQQLKSGAQTDMAKIQATHNAKMEALKLDEKVAQEQARLAREKFDAEKQLEIDKANHAAWLEEQKFKTDKTRAEDKHVFDKQMALNKSAADAETVVMPQIMTKLESAFADVAAGILQMVELQKQTLAAMERPRQVSLQGLTKDASGRVTGGTVTPTIQ